ncbi:MMPL family transporter [Marinicrinis lubricantis]|uniref:MMPL family transporter n=1 Tax=Marinicrinis lubricantis TaxID=2086470 RepID=A0ABW1IUQ2_9BACL
MAKILYRLGSWSARSGKRVIGGALCLLIILAIIAISLKPSFSDDMSIPGTPSEKAGQLLQDEFPSPVEPGGEVHLVFKAPENETLEMESVNQVIRNMLAEIKEDPLVASTASPLELGNLNEDKTIGYAVVTYQVPASEVTEDSKDNILDRIEITRNEGIQTELAGDVSFSELEIGGTSEAIGIIVAYMILALTFTSFLAAGMPILTAVIGLGIGIMLIMIGTNYLDIASFALSLASMLGLAVGIDYALFIMSRFRQQMAKGYSVQESAAIATGTAGNAVVFAGLTVVVALLGFSVARIPFLTMMGVSAAVCVFTAMILAVTVVPALLGMMGHKIGPARKNRFLQKLTRSGTRSEGSNGWGKFVTKRPLFVAVLGILLLGIICIPFFHMELGLPDNGTKSEETTERRAYDLLSEAYGAGYHANLVVAAKVHEPGADVANQLNEITAELSELPNVQFVSPAIPSPSGSVYMFTLTPTTGPNDSETKDLVNAIREKSETLENENRIEFMVTGTTAVNIDISQKLSGALPVFALLIVGFAFILLVLVFRSILVPLKAVLGFLLSLGATLGFVVFVIQDGYLKDLFGFPAEGPVLNFLPVITIGILFGLAMDYEVFLVSRMREEYTHTGNAEKAILAGVKESGGVVTAAGLIMIAVFAGFMLAPDPMIKSMGFALTFGVLFDAFVVRMAIVPAVMKLMGKSAWYLPKWLDKLLPNIDVEGESIMKANHHQKSRD